MSAALAMSLLKAEAFVEADVGGVRLVTSRQPGV